jgi:hypothetical protein
VASLIKLAAASWVLMKGVSLLLTEEVRRKKETNPITTPTESHFKETPALFNPERLTKE